MSLRFLGVGQVSTVRLYACDVLRIVLTFFYITIFLLVVNNIFDEEYESNGYTWGYLAGPTEYRENYYYPQAGRHFMGMISIKF